MFGKDFFLRDNINLLIVALLPLMLGAALLGIYLDLFPFTDAPALIVVDDTPDRLEKIGQQIGNIYTSYDGTVAFLTTIQYGLFVVVGFSLGITLQKGIGPSSLVLATCVAFILTSFLSMHHGYLAHILLAETIAAGQLDFSAVSAVVGRQGAFTAISAMLGSTAAAMNLLYRGSPGVEQPAESEGTPRAKQPPPPVETKVEQPAQVAEQKTDKSEKTVAKPGVAVRLAFPLALALSYAISAGVVLADGMQPCKEKTWDEASARAGGFIPLDPGESGLDKLTEILGCNPVALEQATVEQPVAADLLTARVYTVKKGDSLSRIAKSTGIDLEELMAANNMAFTSLSIGQKLKIPRGKAKRKVVHVVTAEDSLAKIAQKYGVSTSAIEQANSPTLSIGQKLLLQRDEPIREATTAKTTIGDEPTSALRTKQDLVDSASKTEAERMSAWSGKYRYKSRWNRRYWAPRVTVSPRIALRYAVPRRSRYRPSHYERKDWESERLGVVGGLLGAVLGTPRFGLKSNSGAPLLEPATRAIVQEASIWTGYRRITITSNPAGASIIIDAAVQASTNRTVLLHANKLTEIEIRMQGYKPCTYLNAVIDKTTFACVLEKDPPPAAADQN